MDMGNAPGDDLRRELLLAYDQGEGTLEELASRFVVSLGWAKKISAARNRTGRPERVPPRPGRKPRAGLKLRQTGRPHADNAVHDFSWLAAVPSHAGVATAFTHSFVLLGGLNVLLVAAALRPPFSVASASHTNVTEQTSDELGSIDEYSMRRQVDSRTAPFEQVAEKNSQNSHDNRTNRDCEALKQIDNHEWVCPADPRE